MSKRRRSGSSLTDWQLWTAVKRTVTPLRPRAEQPIEQVIAQERAAETLPIPADKPPPVFRKGAAWAGPTLPAYRPPTSAKPRTEPGQVIEPGMKRRLVRGRIEIDATIDLHGMRQDEARAALRQFLPARVARGDRTVLVITGKGLKKTGDLQPVDRGVLRSMLPVWLGEPVLAPFVAGWDVAAPGHGGEGAYYVRLRRVIR